MMSLWDALRMNMMISYQELVRTFLKRWCMLKTRRTKRTFSLHCSPYEGRFSLSPRLKGRGRAFSYLYNQSDQCQ
ncbi:hypothetical protein AWP65_06880 [Escherichia coli]|nr:hypothetical protein AWP52_05760 [Escherichia coli]OKW06486.1 hypothetical protein AWP65_06880 [Escherichia coli]